MTGALPLTTRRVLLVKGKQMDGFVVASAVLWNEDDLEYYDSSPLLPGSHSTTVT